MSHAIGSKEAQASLIDPFSEPEPSAADGPAGSGFRSTYGTQQPNGTSETVSTTSSKNPFKKHSSKHSTSSKTGISSSTRPVERSPPEKFPDYRSEAFADYEPTSRRRAASNATPPSYHDATFGNERPSRRRGSSLRERYPGDKSTQPLDMIRRDSRRAHRSPAVRKGALPGADSIDKLDPAIGGRPYHHEGPYDAALMSRNSNPKHAPLGAVQRTNREALKATPQENIKNAVERHRPLDGVAGVPPGEQDRFGRTYQYREGDDLMREATTTDAGYKRWPGKDYDPNDLKGEGEPSYSLDRALQAHKIDDNGIEMEDRTHLMKDYRDQRRKGTLDQRDPVEIAGDDSKYVDMELSNTTATETGGKHPHLDGLKKRIGSMKHK